MTQTDRQVFCSGCNLVVAPNAPGAFDSKLGLGRVHGYACESKAVRARLRRAEARESLDRTFELLRHSMITLLQKANFRSKSPNAIPAEFTGTPAEPGTYSADVFAALLGSGLTSLYTSCQNGKSYLRPEILAFADVATKALGCRVRVEDPATGGTVVRAAVTTHGRVEKFQQRAAKARTITKSTAKGSRKKR